MEEDMSLQAAKEFIEKARHSEAIQKELNERTKSPVEIGRAHGFDFTQEEFNQAMRESGIGRTTPDGWCSSA